MRYITDFSKSKELQKKSHKLIPGGAHTYSKGDDQFPENAPGFIAKGQGSHAWDIDGNEYIDYGMGLRSVTLGHCYKPVLDAVYGQLKLGTNFTRPSPIEVEAAEEVVKMIPTAEMVKFAKNGSTATTAAVKLARAYTKRDKVALCAEHPFFSYDDWAIGASVIDRGVPKAIKDLTLKFNYNNIESLKKLFEDNPDGISCIIMEAGTLEEPKDNFLKGVEEVCHRNGALFILDEMITGFRWDKSGAQAKYKIKPDMSTFGKGMANGFSVAALVGKREVMDLGGIYHDEERVFLISTTHGAENHSLAACIATLREYKNKDVVGHMARMGELLKDGLNSLAREKGVSDYIEVAGMPCNLAILCKDEKKQISMPFRTLFLQETIKRGILIPWVAISFSHTEEDVDQTIEAFDEVLDVYKKALDEGVEKYLVGMPVKPVFRKYN
ncbi:MAG: glutamate-1-semialdehyde 2,1-aminomutase [Candidatus Altiarchaeota archaeon]|nr:glutamate-1-semialdehyde 2,1-aminomutase [Candidatus Altiarchaeota archaeon]